MTANTLPGTNIREALEKLILPGAIAELRVIDADVRRGYTATVFGYFDDREKMAAAAKTWDGKAPAVYLTLNPCNPALLARAANRTKTAGKKVSTTSDHDIIRRAWLPIDADPIRPAGISSTEEEHRAALERAVAIRGFLAEMGFPDPIFGDSGNGAHLLYRIDLPNDTESLELVKTCIEAVAARFTDGAVEIDRTVFNAARVWKLYGTTAGKGDSIPDRPHRRARILEVPPSLSIVPADLLRALAATAPRPEKPIKNQQEPITTASRTPTSASGIDVPAWCDRVGLTIAKVEPWKDATKHILTPCPFNADHAEAAIFKHPSGAVSFECFHNGCASHDWHKLRDLKEPGWREQVKPQPIEEPRWESPVCFLHRLAPPAFPISALPPAVGRFVSSVAESRQVPPDLPAMLALGVLAASAARRFRIYIGDTHSEPTNLYIAVALPPGNRKSDTYYDITMPLILEEQRILKDKRPEIVRAQEEQKMLDKRLDALRHNAAKEHDKQKRESIAREALNLALCSGCAPAFPQLIVGADTTPEGLSGALFEQGGRIALMDADGGGIFSIMAGRYDKNAEVNLEVFLKAHAGDELRVKRRNRPDEYVHKPALTLALTVQPSVVKALAGHEDFKDRGLLGRFLYSMPESLVGTRFYKNIPIDKQAAAEYKQLVERICRIAPPIPTSDEDLAPHHRLVVQGAALDLWIACYNELERQQAPSCKLAEISDWASKHAGAVARIAGCLHIAKQTAGQISPEIDVATMAEAWQIGNYLIEHAKIAFGMMGASADEAFAKDVMKWIQRESLESFTGRDCLRAHKSRGNVRDGVLPSLHLLRERGIIAEVAPTKHRGRKPDHLFEVNPSCRSCWRCLRDEDD